MESNNYSIIEIDASELEETYYYSTYSALPFNRGTVLKRLSIIPQSLFEEKVKNLHNIVNISGNTNPDKNITIQDFAFDILTHTDIIGKWKYLDDDSFTDMSPRFNTRERFRDVHFWEISADEFANELESVFQLGSCYGPNYDCKEIKTITNDFKEKLLSHSPYKIFETKTPWGKFFIGWFVCFVIIRNDDLIIFAADDYD
ncbi:hypothetical protein AM493_17680 [Flavobacterium akiainvivens]|uniref:Uncharacterized protein n=1 Tax=Flavobacterium akiainvivens TaxID=1202724 RepID=A0A0M9VJF0_9FLAO|nr:hypothetical protein [Flavobacterium akiainvivens]KOS07669.1 hypothetical protein AM493_17680 [Flavobacterium akiainvivens]SFQ23889.1 hypothetical protein SAMN05444144_102117 [Flavobacterium akiainvivens]